MEKNKTINLLICFVGQISKQEYKVKFKNNKLSEKKYNYVSDALMDLVGKPYDKVFLIYNDDVNDVKNSIVNHSKFKYSNNQIEEIKFDFEENNINELFKLINEKIVELRINEIDKINISIDITHGYRLLSMKLLFILDYLKELYLKEVNDKNEYRNKIKIDHLYYGKEPEYPSKGVEIIDFREDYKLQQLQFMIKEFDNTLMLNTKYLNNVFDKGDLEDKLKDAMVNFTNVIQFCNFKKVIASIKELNELIDEFKSNKDNKYYSVIPLLDNVKNKFDDIITSKDELNQKVAFIKLLLKKNLLQLAVTFTDALFIEESLNYCGIIDDINRSDNVDKTRYNVFSFIKYKLTRNNKKSYNQIKEEVKNGDEKNSDVKNFINVDKLYELLFKKDCYNDEIIKKKRGHKYKDIKQFLMGGIIYDFYNEVRNKMDHGNNPRTDIDNIKTETENMLDEVIIKLFQKEQ